MEIGLLWFDDSGDKALKTKVAEAVAAYCAKPRFAGKTPDLCYVHDSALSEGQAVVRVNGVRVIAVANMPPHHLLIGVGSENGRGRKKKRGRSRSRKR